MSWRSESSDGEEGLGLSNDQLLHRYQPARASPTPLSSELEEEREVTRCIKRHRAKGLFSITFSDFCLSRRRRKLSGKAVILLFVIELLERAAYFSALGNILPIFLNKTVNSFTGALLQSVALNIVAQLLYPLAGWIADVWVGRYRMIRWSFGLLWFGYAGLAFSYAIIGLRRDSWIYIYLVWFVLASMGSAGVQVNLIPFAADQVLYKTSDELSSFFYWYYWVRNLAGLAYAISFTCASTTTSDVYIIIVACIATALMTLTIVLTIVLKDWVSDEQERQNPPKMIIGVLLNAVSAKRPQVRSAFSFTGNSSRPPRLDLAKRQHGGKFSEEQVEDVKTFGRILFLLLSAAGVFTVYTGITSVIPLQFNHMKNSYLRHSKLPCTPSELTVWVFNTVTILIFIPILDQCVYPCLREYVPNMLKRIGLGYLILLFSTIVLVLYETIGYHVDVPATRDSNTTSCMFDKTQPVEVVSMSSWLILVPYVFIALAEVFVMVTSLEFVYAQSPHSMRGMMVGLLIWIRGVFSALSSFLLFIFSDEQWIRHLTLEHSHQSCGFWYYLILFVFGILTFALYAVVSRWYQNRTRGDLETDPYYRLRLVNSRQPNINFF